ncbi:Uma2 family endonuclease [Nocardia alni]|uniref:Uma2 family endonuclease n=1 Tax=Nocardia alni TaxID=2815723 RepID=UPI001C21A13E|nr:Uma2 family endonuclease [Nocardia alni]
MTIMVDQQQLNVEEFEKLAMSLERDEMGVRLEYIDGRVGVKPMPDGDHDEIVQWLLKRVLTYRRDLSVYPELGLKIGAYRKGRARPDAVVAPDRSFAGHGEWKDPASVLMVFEVTSSDSDTDRRDRKEKRTAYAEAGIPIYLLVDRDACECVVYSSPVGGTYLSSVCVEFGVPVELPAPLEFTLDSEPLKDLTR